MEDKQKQAISRANRGNNHSSKENPEKNKLLKNIIKEVVMEDDGTKAKEIVKALVDRATDGDLRAIEIILDRIDGKVVQESKIDGNMGHDFNIPIKVITGIDDDEELEDFNGTLIEFVDAKPYLKMATNKNQIIPPSM